MNNRPWENSKPVRFCQKCKNVFDSNWWETERFCSDCIILLNIENDKTLSDISHEIISLFEDFGFHTHKPEISSKINQSIVEIIEEYSERRESKKYCEPTRIYINPDVDLKEKNPFNKNEGYWTNCPKHNFHFKFSKTRCYKQKICSICGKKEKIYKWNQLKEIYESIT